MCVDVECAGPLQPPSIAFPDGALDVASGTATVLSTERVHVVLPGDGRGDRVGSRPLQLEYRVGPVGSPWRPVGAHGAMVLRLGDHQLCARSRVSDSVMSPESASVLVRVEGNRCLVRCLPMWCVTVCGHVGHNDV